MAKRDPKFELFPGADGWRYRIRHANGRIACTSEAYSSKSTARKMVENLALSLRVGWAEIVEVDA